MQAAASFAGFHSHWRAGPPLPPAAQHTHSRRRLFPSSLLSLLQGKDWNGQLKWGTSNFYGANYFQSVTPQLSVGGEVFYLAEQRRR